METPCMGEDGKFVGKYWSDGMSVFFNLLQRNNRNESIDVVVIIIHNNFLDSEVKKTVNLVRYKVTVKITA